MSLKRFAPALFVLALLFAVPVRANPIDQPPGPPDYGAAWHELVGFAVKVHLLYDEGRAWWAFINQSAAQKVAAVFQRPHRDSSRCNLICGHVIIKEDP